MTDVRRSDDDVRQRRQALVVAVGMATPIVALNFAGPILQSSLPGGFVWWRVLQAVLLAMLMVSHASGPILVGGLRALVSGRADRDVLVALALLLAFGAGVAGIIRRSMYSPYFTDAAIALVVVNVARYVQARLKSAAVDPALDAVALVPIAIAAAIAAWIGHAVGVMTGSATGPRAAIAVLLVASPFGRSISPSARDVVAVVYNGAAILLAAFGLIPPGWAAVASNALAVWLMLGAPRSAR